MEPSIVTQIKDVATFYSLTLKSWLDMKSKFQLFSLPECLITPSNADLDL